MHLVQTVVSFSCVCEKCVYSSNYSFWGLKKFYAQVGQTQQFTCCLADTADRQQSASCWLGISLGWPTGLWVGRMLSQSPVPLSQMQTNPSLFISCFLSFIFPSFIHCYFFLVLLVQQPVVSSGCLSTVPANMIKNYFFCYFQVLVFGHIHVPNMIFLGFFRKSVPATSFSFLRISVQYLIKREPLYLDSWVLI